ncbi:AraC-type DNA-binding protein [Myroides marinus]|uniref:AraC-type DNA-binding protein n=1 Tax=Myroides marinus TaxID=703342 RepID=A0A1H6U8U7_9FLAO|nr:helix-turn-helix transcriptional regulator [Myroides marinus]SEI87956.1 AraC-type DNA-binding protein [Myroides marinus]
MSEIKVLEIKQFKEESINPMFYVNEFRTHFSTSKLHIDIPHKHNFYVTVLFTEGSGVHEIDFLTYEVRPGALFFLSPGQTHSWKLSDDINGYIIFHTKEFFDIHLINNLLKGFNFFNVLNQSCVFYCDESLQAKWSNLCDQLIEEHHNREFMRNEYLLSLTTMFYIQVHREMIKRNQAGNQGTIKYNVHYQKFEELVEEYYMKEKSPLYYADKLNITPKHLNRIVRTMVNKSTGEIITDRVILEAKRMFMYSKQSFSEIAYVLGYEDYSYFLKVFKSKENTTPTDFMKRYGL